MTQLVNYDEGRRRIQLATRHDEVAEIRDKAQALAHYARQAKDTELLAWVSEIKVRAERRAGELIREAQSNGRLNGHGGDRKSESKSKATTLIDAGISRDDSSKWQRMAEMPDEQFESGIAAAKDQIGEVTTAFMLRQAEEAKRASEPPKPTARREPSTPVAERADRDGRLARFYVVVRGCEAITELGMTPAQWLEDAPPELRHAISPAIRPAIKWLGKLLEAI